MSNLETSGKLQWACRRGMWELDMLLQPFAEQVYPTLSSQQQEEFRQLLQCQDQELFEWLVTKQRVVDPQFSDMVKAICQFASKQIGNH